MDHAQGREVERFQLGPASGDARLQPDGNLRKTRRMNMPAKPETPPVLRLRILFGKHAMLGPGKAQLLELIRDTGSISAAGRAMKMSYKRAWMLVEEMNAAFRAPLVESARGGPGGGGAQLSKAGEAVLLHYRAVERAATDAGAADMKALQAMLADISGGK